MGQTEAKPSNTRRSIPEVPDEHSSTNRSRNVTTSSSSRPTLGWPFQSHSHNRSISGSWARHSRSASRSRSGSNSTPRRSSRLSSSRRSNGWMSLRPASSLVGDDIIPDYVINYIHGETPESLARKRERAAASAHNAEVHRGQHIQSQAAELDDVNFPRDMEKNAAGGARGTLQGLTTGWKGGITLNIIMASVVLLAAVVCIALAASRGLFTGQEPGVIAQGKCSRVSSLSAGLNALVNVLGLVLVAGANYAAQTLASPTRSDVDRAHAKQGWLDIGIPSLRNLAGISKGRAALSASVLVIALGGHLV